MCTVVCRFSPGEPVPVQVLALRDELASRSFDLPGAWWPERPGVIGGRDRQAGGTWCASDVARGVTAVVLNRPERLVAAAGAASRGVLPLLAVEHGSQWVEHVDTVPMASFNLVLIEPDALSWWAFDGERLSSASLAAGSYLFTPRGLADGIGAELVGAASRDDVFADPPADAATVWPEWLGAVRASVPDAEHSGLLIVRPVDNAALGVTDSYETVFGQLIAARPGALRIDHLSRVARDPGGPWTPQLWPVPSE